VRNDPSAVPHGASPNPILRESTAPTFHGSRRAQPGYSTGGVGGAKVAAGFELETSSTAVSSAPPSGSDEEDEEAGLFWTADVGAGPVGCGADCCASAGSARTTAADALRMSLVRIAPGRGDRDLDGVGWLLLWRAGKEEESADNQHGDDDENDQSGHEGGFCRARKPLYSPLGDGFGLPVTDLGRRLDRPVVLVGLMGVGKSTVGRRLARRLGLAFVDSDAEIEDAAGFPAAEVFERFGEREFRDGERRLVARLIEGDIRVIATGGGAYVDPSTRKLLNERAITVWLDAPVDILAERTSRRDTRAQLRNNDRKTVLERLSQERRPSYAEAHIHVRSGDGAHKDVVEAIVHALDDYLGNSAGA
jgi:shikimate kinase